MEGSDSAVEPLQRARTYIRPWLTLNQPVPSADSTRGEKRTDMVTSRVLVALVTSLCMLSAACGFGDFNEGRCRNSIEANPVKLDGEQVMLTPTQIDCGFRNDLWDPPTYDDNQRGVARDRKSVV